MTKKILPVVALVALALPASAMAAPKAKVQFSSGAYAVAENSGPAVPAPVILSALASPPAPAAATKPTNAYEGAPTCSECGMLMVPNGACYKCENCGSTSGCS